jgi:hypothetical protein
MLDWVSIGSNVNRQLFAKRRTLTFAKLFGREGESPFSWSRRLGWYILDDESPVALSAMSVVGLLRRASEALAF